jgi:purine-binding chemotaxis protein CheW
LFEKEKVVKKFVLFTLGEDCFGVPVEQVAQVTDFERVYRVPGTPKYVLGVMNLRGNIITLINLKKRLQLGDEKPKEGEGQVIFVDVMNHLMGMVVDKVVSLVSIPLEAIKEELELISTKIDMEFLKGAAAIEEGILVLLNLDMVLSEYEVEEIVQYREKFEDEVKKQEKKEEQTISEETLIDLNLEDDLSRVIEEEEKIENDTAEPAVEKNTEAAKKPEKRRKGLRRSRRKKDEAKGK